VTHRYRRWRSLGARTRLTFGAFNRTAVWIGRGLHIGSLCSFCGLRVITDVLMMSGVMLPGGFQSSFL
jgi:hypothetical protein